MHLGIHFMLKPDGESYLSVVKIIVCFHFTKLYVTQHLLTCTTLNLVIILA